MVPTDPNTWLLRVPLAEALTEAGYPISAGTLAAMGHKGGGPSYEIFNNKARYRWGDSLAWAQSRVRRGGRRTADLEAA